jgi:hypothetical protein
MSLEQKYKDYFKLKTQEELYELIVRLKMFIDLSLQESAAGNADDRLKSMHATILKLRDSLVYELSINNHSKNLLKMEEDHKRFEELNAAALESNSKKNLDLEQEQEKDQ